MTKKAGFDTGWVLQLVVAAFLITMGLIVIINYDSDLNRFGRSVTQLFGGKNDPTALIIAIVNLIAGALLVLALFVPVRGNLLSLLTLIIVIVWIVQAVLRYFVNDFLEPDFLTWLNGLSLDLIVLTSLWIVNRRYA